MIQTPSLYVLNSIDIEEARIPTHTDMANFLNIHLYITIDI